MKTILSLLLLTVLSVRAGAADVRLYWPGGEGDWSVEQSDGLQLTPFLPVKSVTAPEATVTGLAPGMYSFRVRAVFTVLNQDPPGHVFSDPSNVVTATVLPPPGPLQIQNPLRLAIEASDDLQTWQPIVQVSVPPDRARRFYRPVILSSP